MVTTKTGIVTVYKVDKNYGFIKDNEDGTSYFFLLDKKEQITLKRSSTPIAFIRKGDILNFTVRQSLLRPSEKEAHNLIFVGNSDLDKLVEQEASGLTLYGQLKKIDDRYYIQDKVFEILLPLKILAKDNLTNIEFDKLLKDEQIEYRIERRKNPTKVFANLVTT